MIWCSLKSQGALPLPHLSSGSEREMSPVTKQDAVKPSVPSAFYWRGQTVVMESAPLFSWGKTRGMFVIGKKMMQQGISGRPWHKCKRRIHHTNKWKWCLKFSFPLWELTRITKRLLSLAEDESSRWTSLQNPKHQVKLLKSSPGQWGDVNTTIQCDYTWRSSFEEWRLK